MKRVSMSLPKKLLNDFDDVLRDRGYNSRSNGIRNALKDYIVRYQQINEINGIRIGILAVTYNYHYNGVMEDLNNIQTEFMEHINGIIHLTLDKTSCLDIIIIKSDSNHIKNLSEKIQRHKGVEHVQLSTLLVENI